jgi:hypothetical protein
MARTNLNIVGVRAANATDLVDVTGVDTRDTIAPITTGRTDILAVGANAANGTPISSYNGITSTLKQSLAIHYDFATDGGAIGTIQLRGGVLPINAIITNAWLEVTTAFLPVTTSTFAIGLTGATTALRTAAVATVAPAIDAAARVGVIAPQTPSSFVAKSTTVNRNFVGTIASGAFTAGAFVLHVDYVVSALDTTTAATN